MTEPEKVELAGFVAVVVKMFCGLPKDTVVNVWHSDEYDFVSVRFVKTAGSGLSRHQCSAEFSVGRGTVLMCRGFERLGHYVQELTSDALAKIKAMEDRRTNELAKVPG